MASPGDITVRSARIPFMPTPRATMTPPSSYHNPRPGSPTRQSRLTTLLNDDDDDGPHPVVDFPRPPSQAPRLLLESYSPPQPAPLRSAPSAPRSPRSNDTTSTTDPTPCLVGGSGLPTRRPGSPMRPSSPSKLPGRPSSPTRPSSPMRPASPSKFLARPSSPVRPRPASPQQRRREQSSSIMLPPSPTKRLNREPSPLTTSSKANVDNTNGGPPVIRAKVTQGLFCSQAKKPQPWPSTKSSTSPSPNTSSVRMSPPAKSRAPPALASSLFDVSSTKWVPPPPPPPPPAPTDTTPPQEENVVVHIRVRPSDKPGMWSADPLTSTICADDNSRQGQNYTFDGVHTGSDNAPVYLTTGRPLVQAVLDGYDAVLFAYGQTASGKTFTLLGDDAGTSPGIIPRAIKDVFEGIAHADQGQREFLLRVSYLEIYNEQVKDLLDPSNKPQLRDDPVRRPGSGRTGGGVVVKPLCEEIVTSPQAVAELLQRGQINRHIGATDWNERSSRSHTCFKLTVESWLRSDASTVRVSELSLIDLAGSERYVSQGATRRAEGAFINKSLLTLGKVIYHLTEPTSAGSVHIPYRDSKLTRLLQNSLSGQARVAVICTLNPSPQAAEESVSTLQFARRCKKVAVHAERREVWASASGQVPHEFQALLVRYKSETEQLRYQLAQRTEGQEDQWGEIRQRLDLLERIKVRGGTTTHGDSSFPARPVSPIKGGGLYGGGVVEQHQDEEPESVVDLSSSAHVLREKLFAAEAQIKRLKEELQTRPHVDKGASETIAELRQRCAELEVVIDGMGGAAALDSSSSSPSPGTKPAQTHETEYLARIAALEEQVQQKDAYAARLVAECAELQQDKKMLWLMAHGKTSALVHGCASSTSTTPNRPRRSRSLSGFMPPPDHQDLLLGGSLDSVAQEVRSTLSARLASDDVASAHSSAPPSSSTLSL